MDNGYYNQGMNQMPQSATEFTKYLVLSIIQLLCCCQITGIIALVFTILANSSFKVGNLMDYQSKIKSAKTTLTVGWIVAAVIYIIVIIMYAATFSIALLSN